MKKIWLWIDDQPKREIWAASCDDAYRAAKMENPKCVVGTQVAD